MRSPPFSCKLQENGGRVKVRQGQTGNDNNKEKEWEEKKQKPHDVWWPHGAPFAGWERSPVNYPREYLSVTIYASDGRTIDVFKNEASDNNDLIARIISGKLQDKYRMTQLFQPTNIEWRLVNE